MYVSMIVYGGSVPKNASDALRALGCSWRGTPWSCVPGADPRTVGGALITPGVPVAGHPLGFPAGSGPENRGLYPNNTWGARGGAPLGLSCWERTRKPWVVP